MDKIRIIYPQSRMNVFCLNFETFHILEADPADMIRTVTDSADAIRTSYMYG